MSELINQLLDEHKKLFALLDKIRNISDDAAKKELFNSKMLFLSHLDKEDKMLYKKFDEAASLGINVPSNVVQFKEEMKSISTGVIDFFDKYKDSIQDKIQFGRDFGRIYSLLKIRMNKEEMQLYPTYEKYFS